MLNFAFGVLFLALIIGSIGLFFMLYLMIKYWAHDIAGFMNRRANYLRREQAERDEAKKRHPSAQRNIFDQEQYID